VADGNGTFTITGQPTHTIEICSNGDEIENEDEERMLYPQVKVLARAKHPPEMQISLPAAAILLEGEVTLAPHGNSKRQYLIYFNQILYQVEIGIQPWKTSSTRSY